MWRTEWKAISDRIQGLLDAGRFYLESQLVRREDSYNVANGELLPHIRRVVEALETFHADYQALLPPTAVACLKRFIERSRRWDFTPGALSGLPAVQGFLTVLVSFRSEFTYQISDSSAVAKRLSERAFTHLQRSIVADLSIRERWAKAFEVGETACEKLGGTHLLLHGIWAFKVNAEGERTDLVLGEPLRDLAEAERTAEALVLTEWKLVRTESELAEKIRQAHAQAARYASGALAGFELAQYRYLVMVSKPVLRMPPDGSEGEIIYRHLNIAVDPKPPSSE
jgi:hypothetical protein